MGQQKIQNDFFFGSSRKTKATLSRVPPALKLAMPLIFFNAGLLTLCLAGCGRGGARAPHSPAQVMFVMSTPFEGQITIFNEPGALNPVQMGDGTRQIEIDPGGRNTYDHKRFPGGWYQARGRFFSGEKIEVDFQETDAKYCLRNFTVDGSGNMQFSMARINDSP
jgi:hypothetical protein